MIDKSFFLVRTNPLLTGNVKLVVSSDYKLYLESFDINKDLSQDRLKHFEIKKDEYYKEVLPYFFKDIEAKNIFEAKSNNDASEMYNEYRFQFDDEYFSGAFFSEDTWYKEEYEYLAPLYIKQNMLPNNFIILRVDGAGQLSEEANASNFRNNIINNWKFVSMYDLTPKTDLGEWIDNNFSKDDDLPKFPLVVRHEENSLSEITGIDLNYGGWATRYVNLNELQSQNTPIFRTEEHITNMWQDNNIIYPHVVNFKFLFDDTPATPTSLREYSMNRYVGFYINEMDTVKYTTPYQGVELNKPSFDDFDIFSAEVVSEIPYINNNLFVRTIKNRTYSFDPIKKGWDTTQTYWVEFEGSFFRLERVENKDKNIIGSYLYKIVSDKKIEFSLNIVRNSTTALIQRVVNNAVVDEYEVSTPKNNIDESVLKQMRKVLITDLSTSKDKINITTVGEYNNIIENTNTQVMTSKRVYDWTSIKGSMVFLFTLDVESEIVEESTYNNIFHIDNFDEADLHLMKIGEQYHVIKKYDNKIPVVGGKYYLHTDWMVNVDNKSVSSWINNGNTTKNPMYYKFVNLDSINYDQTPPVFEILRANFTDIKDFDFDRVTTEYANYEYEKENDILETDFVEPKLYAKEYRDVSVKVRTLPSDKVRRIPILDINNRPYYLRAKDNEPNPFTKKPYTEEELFRQELDGSWALFDGEVDGEEWKGYRTKDIAIQRDLYREENYIWRVENDNQISEIDFTTSSNPKLITEDVTWNYEIGTKQKDNGLKIKSKSDPNVTFDKNYIPVSSEYIASDELWEVRNNNLTNIWSKNQAICKWGFMNSLGLHDYPYRLNYSFDMAGSYNKEPHISGQEVPLRKHLDLEYFYRFGINNPSEYNFYSLHLKDVSFEQINGFNIDKYISSDFDYFEYLLKSDQEISKGLTLTNKYSKFVSENEFGEAYTVFRGIKYSLADVENIVKNIDDNSIIDNIITKGSEKYSDYSFSILFSKKPSAFLFNSGTGSSNSGIDVYLNDIWKNVVIHLYIDTNETIEMFDSNNQTINAETCNIDNWYQDYITSEEIDPVNWNRTGFKIGGLDIDVRPRDFMLSRFLFILNNYNYLPSENKNPINFIHIYNDGREPKIMSYEDTDFIIKGNLPTEILAKESVYKTIPLSINQSLLSINNSIKNRIILPQSNGGGFTTEGYRVGSISDINSYNDYPIGKQIILANDLRPNWELSHVTDPSFHRHSGPFTPIFKTIPLFRPMGYNELVINSNKPKLKSGNWKFYDIESSDTKPNVKDFGMISEIIYSKCNPISNVLKLQDELGKGKSIYPMVDEYGYDFDSRYLFSSTWDINFNYLSRRVEVQENVYAGIAGHTVDFDGMKNFLRIPDAPKFNLETYLLEENNFSNNINVEPEGERSFYRKTLLSVDKVSRSFDLKLLANMEYVMSINFHNYKKDSNLGSEVTEQLRVVIEIINDPADATQIENIVVFDNVFDISTTSNPLNLYTNKFALKSTTNTLAVPEFPSESDKDKYLKYIYGNVINTRVHISYMTESNSVVDVYPIAFQLSTVLNFVDFDMNIENVLPDVVNEWGGYLRKDGKDPQEGDVTNYPFKVKSTEFSSYVSISNELSRILKPNGYAVSNIKNSLNTSCIRVSNLDNFTFEPERWTNYEDGKSITYIGRKVGNSLVIPKHKLKWYNVYKEVKKPIESKPIYKYESEQGRAKLMQQPKKKKPAFIPGVIKRVLRSRLKPVEAIYYSENNDIHNHSRYYGETARIGLSDVVDFYEHNKTDDIIPTPKYVQPFGKISFIPSQRFLPVPLPKPQILVDDVVETVTSMEEELPSKIEFQIIPENGTAPISVSVSTRSPFDGSALSIEEVLGLINDQLPTTYVVTYEDVKDANYEMLIITSAYSGSYYNFKINILSSHLEIVESESEYAFEEVVTSEKYTKATLKSERLNGTVGSFTIEFQIKVGTWSKENETILYKGLDNGNDAWNDESFNDFMFIIGRDSITNGIAFRTCHKKIHYNFEKHTLSSQKNLNDGKWHTVACIVDSVTRTKTIIIDDIVEASVSEYLTPTYNTITQGELVVLFLDRENRFANGLSNVRTQLEKINRFPTVSDFWNHNTNTLVEESKYTTTAKYWYDVMRGYKDMSYWEKNIMNRYMATTIDIAYKSFQENFESLDYYLHASINNKWDILIATDNTVSTLGMRTFNGSLDELRIWNYARSNSQIINNSRFLLRPESYLDPLKSLVAYFRFDEGKGSNTIKDLMGGKMIKSLVKWCRVRTQYINNGQKEVEKDELRYYIFDKDFFEGADIEADTESFDWVVSGAKILGVSDERYATQAPPPSIKEEESDIEKPIYNKTKFVLEKKAATVVDVKNHIIKATKVPNDNDFVKVGWLNRFKDSVDKLKFINKTPIIEPKQVVVKVKKTFIQKVVGLFKKRR